MSAAAIACDSSRVGPQAGKAVDEGCKGGTGRL